MRKNEIIKSLLCTMLIGAMLFSANPLSVAADEWQDEQANGYEIMETSTETTTTTVDYGPAGIENGAVYAMQNVGTGLWAGTRGSTDVTGISNVFQHTSWSSDYQTFTFEKTDTADNTYIIYTAETDTSGGKYALYCEYSTSAAANINVYPRVYNSSSAKSGFEWQIVQQDGYIHSIHLNADPAYKLYVRGTTAGSESNTAVSSVGNIIARKTTSTSIAEQQKWRLVYVLPEGEYYIKNRGTSDFLHSSSNDVITQGFLGNNSQKWRLDHYQNGKYQIYPSNAYNLVYLTSSQDGGDVSLSGNNMQPSSMWYIDRHVDGSFKIESAWTHSLELDYALQPNSTNNVNVINGSCVYGMRSMAEWFFIPTNGIYGIRTFEDAGEDINNESYALDTSYYDLLDPPISNLVSYQQNVENGTTTDLEDIDRINIYNILRSTIKSRIEGLDTVKSVVSEDIYGSTVLNSNQYRIAIRFGVCIEASDYDPELDKELYTLCYDAYLWYQTYDGTWAHKVSSSSAKHMEKDVMPSDVVYDGVNVRYHDSYGTKQTIERIEQFYNSPTYYYIITTE